MRKILIMTVASMILAACSQGNKREKTSFKDLAWEQVEPVDLDFNPFQRIGKDWMALAMGNGESMNSMTISWGTAGELWNKPVFIVYVSSDRFSKELMDKQKYFTVMSFPNTRANKEALGYIGSRSGRDEPAKTENAGFTVEYTERGNPIFKEAELSFECKILYKEEFKHELLPAEVKPRYEQMGLHTMYIGEIVSVLKKK